MKVLHIIPTYKPAYVYGGPIFSVSLICENLAKEGHEVLMLTTTANGKYELEVPIGKKVMVDGVPTIYYKRWTKDHTHFSPGLMWNVFTRCKKYDAVHIHSWWNIPVMVSVLLCWLRGVRPIVSPRGMLSDFTFGKNHSSIKGIFHNTVGKFLLRKTQLHLTAESEQKEIASIGAKSFVLPNYIQLADPLTLHPHKNGEDIFSIIFLSRIHPKKNIEGLFKALQKVDFNFKLKMAGMGEEAYITELKKLADSLGISRKINWLGEVHGNVKFQEYASADLFVLPSFNENFANVVIEALSAGTPVMVSEHVGLAKYVSENDLGWICSTEEENIAAVLKKVYGENEKRNAIRGQAIKTVQRDFSPRRLTERYIKKYAAIKGKSIQMTEEENELISGN